MQIHVRAPAAAAIWVMAKAWPVFNPLSTELPALKPNQPTQSRPAPIMVITNTKASILNKAQREFKNKVDIPISRWKEDVTENARKCIFLTEHLFCQTLIFRNVLSKMWFCQNTANNVLSRFVEFLSNTGGYIDSVLFCQSLAMKYGILLIERNPNLFL